MDTKHRSMALYVHFSYSSLVVVCIYTQPLNCISKRLTTSVCTSASLLEQSDGMNTYICGQSCYLTPVTPASYIKGTTTDNFNVEKLASKYVQNSRK